MRDILGRRVAIATIIAIRITFNNILRFTLPYNLIGICVLKLNIEHFQYVTKICAKTDVHSLLCIKRVPLICVYIYIYMYA